MDVIYIFKILLRRIWIIIAVPVIAGAAAYLFTQNLPKEYKSSAQISTGFTTKNKIQLSKESFDYWESKSNFENLVEVMKSDLVGSMVAYRLLIYDLEEADPFRKNEFNLSTEEILAIKQKLRSNISSFKLLSSYDEFENRIIEVLNKKSYSSSKWIKDGDLMIGRIRDTDFVRVEFKSENPFLSAFVVNKLCEEYLRYNSEIENSVSEESLIFLTNEVEKKKKELDEKTKQLNDFKNSNQVFNYDIESNSKLSQLTDYEVKLQEEENKLRALALSLKSVDAKINSLSASGGAANNAKLLELRSKINELNKIYVEGGATDKDLESTINELRNQLQLELQKVDLGSNQTGKRPKTLSELRSEKEDIELEIAISNSNIESIKRSITSLKGNVSIIGSKEYTIASMERERENAFKDYSSYVEKLNDAKSKSLISGSGLKLMITGQPNPKPEPSKRLAILVIAVMGSFFMCIGLFLTLEYFDNTLKTPDKFERFTKIKLLGYLKYQSFNVSDFPYTAKKAGEEKEVEHMMHLLRKIRFNIENTKKQVFIISSTSDGDGKSFFIKSLAQSLSLLGKRVLIMDTNFRNNSLSKLVIDNKMLQRHSQFKLLNDAYVNDADSEEQSNNEEYSRSIIFPTSDKNVDIIASRRGFESPSELFAGRSFYSLLETLRHKYDYVLMEGPSMNEYSDTKELVEYADGIIAVFSGKRSITSKDRESIKYLKSLNGKFIGAVLNFVHEDELG